MEEKDTNNISYECKPEENQPTKVDESIVLNYLSTNWNDNWEQHHGDIS